MLVSFLYRIDGTLLADEVEWCGVNVTLDQVLCIFADDLLEGLKDFTGGRDVDC